MYLLPLFARLGRGGRRWLSRNGPAALALFGALLGVILGSFLNVVAHRLPRQLDRESRAWARDLLGLAPDAEVERPPTTSPGLPPTARAAKSP